MQCVILLCNVSLSGETVPKFKTLTEIKKYCGSAKDSSFYHCLKTSVSYILTIGHDLTLAIVYI